MNNAVFEKTVGNMRKDRDISNFQQIKEEGIILYLNKTII